MRTTVFLACITISCIANVASAGPVTWEYAGEINSVTDHGNIFDGTITVGMPFSGYFTFESTTPNSSSSGGIYRDAILDTLGQVGELEFGGPLAGILNAITVFNFSVPGVDEYSAQSGVNFLDQEGVFFAINLSDESELSFIDFRLPIEPLSLDVFEGIFTLQSFPNTFSIVGTVTHLVPEPTSLSLLVLSIAAVLSRRRPRVA